MHRILFWKNFCGWSVKPLNNTHSQLEGAQIFNITGEYCAMTPQSGLSKNECTANTRTTSKNEQRENNMTIPHMLARCKQYNGVLRFCSTMPQIYHIIW